MPMVVAGIAAVAAAGGAAVGGGILGGMVAGAISGAIYGAVIGGVMAAVQGGDILEGALSGGLTGAIGGAVLGGFSAAGEAGTAAQGVPSGADAEAAFGVGDTVTTVTPTAPTDAVLTQAGGIKDATQVAAAPSATQKSFLGNLSGSEKLALGSAAGETIGGFLEGQALSKQAQATADAEANRLADEKLQRITNLGEVDPLKGTVVGIPPAPTRRARDFSRRPTNFYDETYKNAQPTAKPTAGQASQVSLLAAGGTK